MVADIQLERACDYAESICVYDGGEITEYGKEDAKFKSVCASWKGMLASSHQMPAFGVSLHTETSQAIKRGVWVEFNFNQAYSSEGLIFEKLLFNVLPQNTGFNIIRYNTGVGYDGRCFYFDLIGHDMSDFYSIVKS